MPHTRAVPPYYVTRDHGRALSELSQARQDKDGWRDLVPGRSVERPGLYDEAAHRVAYRALDADGTLLAEGTASAERFDLDGEGTMGEGWVAAFEFHEAADDATVLEITDRVTGDVSRPIE